MNEANKVNEVMESSENMDLFIKLKVSSLKTDIKRDIYNMFLFFALILTQIVNFFESLVNWIKILSFINIIISLIIIIWSAYRVFLNSKDIKWFNYIRVRLAK